jgi:type IV pilus assembly protein PilC
MTRAQIIKGGAISASMSEHSFFPKVLTKMVSVGEQSGSLPDVLDKTCTYYERRVETTITTIMSVLEPALIVTVGGIVLVVVLALYLPIFTISDVKQ